MQSRSKNAQLARKVVEANMKDVVAAKLDKFGDRLPAEIMRMGFKHVKIINRLVNDAKGKPHRNHSSGSLHKPLHPTSSSKSVMDNKSWGLPQNSNESVHATKGEAFDQITNYTKQCPACKAPLIIITSTQGQVLEVRHAPTIAK
jgi:hypothetical protein